MLDQLERLRREIFGVPPEASKALEELWRDVFGEPPPVTGAPSLLSKVLVASLPPAPPYTPAPIRLAPAQPADPPAAATRGPSFGA
jgi:hypothetical protein